MSSAMLVSAAKQAREQEIDVLELYDMNQNGMSTFRSNSRYRPVSPINTNKTRPFEEEAYESFYDGNGIYSK